MRKKLGLAYYCVFFIHIYWLWSCRSKNRRVWAHIMAFRGLPWINYHHLHWFDLVHGLRKFNRFMWSHEYANKHWLLPTCGLWHLVDNRLLEIHIFFWTEHRMAPSSILLPFLFSVFVSGLLNAYRCSLATCLFYFFFFYCALSCMILEEKKKVMSGRTKRSCENCVHRWL